MLCTEGRIAATAFTSFAVLTLYQLKIYYGNYWSYEYCLLAFAAAIVCTFVMPYSDIIKRAALLGTFFGGSLILIFVTGETWRIFWLYMLYLTFFHFSEYMMTACYNAERLSIDSFLLNHSVEYQSAAVASFIEFLLEAYYFPKLKCIFILNFIGLLLVTSGEVLRKLAMITAKSNFSHIVQSSKGNAHQLVTHGVYGFSRHPSYVGWFYWSIGTQILLCNPLCCVAYTIASWQFFNERVRDEEYYLLQFFGGEYLRYMEEVPTRLPFISGLQDFAEKSSKQH